MNGDSATITFMSSIKGFTRYITGFSRIWPARKGLTETISIVVLKVRPRLEVSRMNMVRLVIFDFVNHENVQKCSEVKTFHYEILI